MGAASSACTARRSPRGPAPPAGVTFALAPDWSGNEWLIAVHNFLHAFAGSDPHRLWITADPRQMTLGAVLERLRPLLLPFGDRPFAEIFLSETPPERGHGAAAVVGPRACPRLQLRVVPLAGAGRRRREPRDPNGAKVYW